MGHLQTAAEAVDPAGEDAARTGRQHFEDMVFMRREVDDLHRRGVIGRQYAIGQPASSHCRLMIEHIHCDRRDAPGLGGDQLGPVAPVDQPRGKMKDQIAHARRPRAGPQCFGDQFLDLGADSGKDSGFRKETIENRGAHDQKSIGFPR